MSNYFCITEIKNIQHVQPNQFHFTHQAGHVLLPPVLWTAAHRGIDTSFEFHDIVLAE